MPEPNDHSDVAQIASESKGWLNAITKHLVWMTPVTCVLAIIYSLIQLGKIPASWLGPINDISRPFLPFEIDPLVCLITSGIAFAYWMKRDGWENISRWSHMLGLKARFRELDRIAMEKEVSKRVEKEVKAQMLQREPEMLAKARAEVFAQLGIPDPELPAPPPDSQG